MQINKKSEFVYDPNWYRGLDYPRERERGYDSNEDLLVPGYFETEIRKGEQIIFSAGLNEIKSSSLKRLVEKEADSLEVKENFYQCLVRAAHQFRIQDGGENYLIAGWPWFKCRARDMFIALPGLTLYIGETKLFETYMETAIKAIDDFTSKRPISVKIYEMEHPDILLWAVWCIQQYAKIVSKKRVLRQIPQGASGYNELHPERQTSPTCSCTKTAWYSQTGTKKRLRG